MCEVEVSVDGNMVAAAPWCRGVRESEQASVQTLSRPTNIYRVHCLEVFQRATNFWTRRTVRIIEGVFLGFKTKETRVPSRHEALGVDNDAMSLVTCPILTIHTDSTPGGWRWLGSLRHRRHRQHLGGARGPKAVSACPYLWTSVFVFRPSDRALYEDSHKIHATRSH